MKDDEKGFAILPVRWKYASLPLSHLDASSQDVAYLYAAYARDKRIGSTDATNFEDAVRQHKLIDRIVQASEAVALSAR